MNFSLDEPTTLPQKRCQNPSDWFLREKEVCKLKGSLQPISGHLHEAEKGVKIRNGK